MDPVKWGVLSTAKIARERVIPSMQKSPLCRVHAIASRDLEKANLIGDSLGIDKRYGNYEQLLNDPEIEAIYNLLPNHLHVPWSIHAANAGKHVLCEKPISLNANEVGHLIRARDTNKVLIEEAFMPRHHPQWKRVRTLLQEGAVGEIRAVQAAFSYHNINPSDVRNQSDIGGGGLYDIGSYCIALTRFVFDQTPLRVTTTMDVDSSFGVDRLSSAILDFGEGRHSTLICGTQMARHQGFVIVGTKNWIRINCPFAMPDDWKATIDIGENTFPGASVAKSEVFPESDQYLLQSQNFAAKIRNEEKEDYPLEDALENMKVIDALFRAAQTAKWEPVT